MYSDKQNINILTALLVKHGVEHVVVCPGSRNAPLVHNFSECPDIECHPVTDERSAAFIALGLRKQSERPVAVCVTSGSALLNVLPGAAEATYQQQGIIVISADRPAQWIDQLDGQTLPQEGALGKFVGKSVSLPEPHNPEERWYCNRLINEALLENMKPAHPSVHINVPISEPLFNFSEASLPKERGIGYTKWNDDTAMGVVRKIAEAKRPMIAVGQLGQYDLPDDYFAELTEKIVTLYEPLSADEQPVCQTDLMLHAISRAPKNYQPDCVLFIGGHTVSKRLRQFLRALPDETFVMMANEDGAVRDVTTHANLIIEGIPGRIVSDINGYLRQMPGKQFFKRWTELHERVKAVVRNYAPAYSSMLAVKMFEESVDTSACIHYANSMPVRLASIYADHYCHCNRGLNGIEGTLSTAAGAALLGELTFCVIGDLSFFYDENALWQQQLGDNFHILLLNNHQGAIFRNLKGLEESDIRDEYVAGGHSLTAEGICNQFGITYLCATDEQSLRFRMSEFTAEKRRSNRPLLLEIITDAADDELAYKTLYDNIIKP